MTTTDDRPIAAQSALPFEPRVVAEPPFVPGPAQGDATATILRHWTSVERSGSGLTTVLLTGPRGSGKTRLLEELAIGRPELIFEVIDVDEADPLGVFAEINRAAAQRQLLILEGRGQPARWFGDGPEVPPDLRSRLAAAPLVRVDLPGSETLAAVLAADLKLHGQKLSDEELSLVARELPRSFGAPRAFCRALDRAGGGLGRRALLRWALEQAHVASAATTDRGSEPRE